MGEIQTTDWWVKTIRQSEGIGDGIEWGAARHLFDKIDQLQQANEMSGRHITALTATVEASTERDRLQAVEVRRLEGELFRVRKALGHGDACVCSVCSEFTTTTAVAGITRSEFRAAFEANP